MSHQTETHYCSACDADTSHVLVLVRKESPYKSAENRKTKEFLAGLFKGMAVGHLSLQWMNLNATLSVKNVATRSSKIRKRCRNYCRC